MHTEAATKIQKVILEDFGEIKLRINADIPTHRKNVQQFMMKRGYEEERDETFRHDAVAVNANAASPHYFSRCR